MNRKIGFTIGKFAPLHKGHQYLIETAINETDEFIAVIYETDIIDIPIDVRANWIKALYPNVKVLNAIKPPNQYGLDEQSIKIQNDYLKNIIKDIPVTHFYSSEPYGKYVARDLHVIDRRVDNKREYNQVSSTHIRQNLDKYKEFLDDIVYKDCIKYL